MRGSALTDSAAAAAAAVPAASDRLPPAPLRPARPYSTHHTVTLTPVLLLCSARERE